MSGLISQKGLQPEVPGYKPPEAFEVPKSPDFPQETREAADLRTSHSDKAGQEDLDTKVIKERILQQAEKLKAAGEVIPSEVDAGTKAMLEGLMTGKLDLDEVGEFNPYETTRGLMG